MVSGSLFLVNYSDIFIKSTWLVYFHLKVSLCWLHTEWQLGQGGDGIMRSHYFPFLILYYVAIVFWSCKAEIRGQPDFCSPMYDFFFLLGDGGTFSLSLKSKNFTRNKSSHHYLFSNFTWYFVSSFWARGAEYSLTQASFHFLLKKSLIIVSVHLFQG